MIPAWAQRKEGGLSDGIVSPDVFNRMVDTCAILSCRTNTPWRPRMAGAMHLYLQGLLSHLPRKNAEDIAALVNVDRQVIQDFIGIEPWDHRPLIPVLVGEVVD